VGPTLGSLVFGFVILTIVFWPLERLRPAIPEQPRWRRGTLTDLGYWFFTPLVTRVVTRAALIVSVVALAAAAGVPLRKPEVQAFLVGNGSAVQRQPLWLQVVEVLVLGDLIGYWTHRLFHGRELWPFHAVHHSSTEVDWLSSVRLHPVNDVVSRLLQSIPLLLLGFPPGLMAGYLPFLTFYALLIHANVSWDFGPLRHVIASPAFHRWHHTSQAEGLDKNFAGLFPWIDRLFGTYHMPEGRQARQFGILGGDVPEGLLAQLAYPFRSRARTAAALPAPASAPEA
jgi:sterol desaturase/sphingolipid hydroxylase (fatty acid hydroxylase superfamily)